MREFDLLHAAVEPAVAKGPIEPGITMVLLTAAERRALVEILEGHEHGAAATARVKLRAAAPVRDAELLAQNWTGFKRIFRAFFETDGREKGECRWCKKTARIDQYHLCSRCLPKKQSALCET